MEQGRWATQGRHCHHGGTGWARRLGWIITVIGVAMRGASASLSYGESPGAGDFPLSLTGLTWTREDCTRWGAVSCGRKNRMIPTNVDAKLCEGWTACMHEGSTSYQNDRNARMGEGWTACVHGGPTSCQTNTGNVGGGFSSFSRRIKRDG